MAARVLLLSVLITIVVKPTCIAGITSTIIGNRGCSSNLSITDGSDIGREITLEIQPSGHVIIGNRRGITLNCITNSNKNTSWLYNGKSAPPCGLARCDLLSNGSLHFYKKPNLQMQKFKGKGKNGVVNVKNNNKDEYRCITNTSLGLLQSAPTFVQIAELAHVFKESPENIAVQEGEVARLSCLIDSVPFPPDITWQHNGTLLSYNNESKYSVVPPGVLYISATKLSDAGLYRCIATNKFLKGNRKSKEAKLTVILRSDGNRTHSPSYLFPQLSYSHRLLNGSNLTLACAASGYPSPFITWSFIPRSIDNITQSHILLNSATGVGVLSLKNVSSSNAGVYSCSLKNLITNYSEVQNVTVDILVPPSFIKKPTDKNCLNGLSTRFECQAEGSPTPQIYWLKNLSNITTNGRYAIHPKDYNKIELVISSLIPRDFGIYQCVAVNSAGEIWAAGRLQINVSLGIPATVTDIGCRSISEGTIRIFWNRSVSYPNLTAHTVQYRPVEGGREIQEQPLPSTAIFADVNGLEAFTNYSFYVRVYRLPASTSLQSNRTYCRTLPDVPQSIPKININVISSTKLNVSWEPLSKKEARGVVIKYKLQWRLHQHLSTKTVLDLPATTEHYILSDLIPGAQYDLRVIAETINGGPNRTAYPVLPWNIVTIPSSESDQFTVKNVDIKVDIKNASVVKMKWYINLKGNIKPEFDSWQVYCEDQNGQKLATILLPQNVTEYTFTDLNMNFSYTMGLCMMSLGEAIDCLTAQSDLKNIQMALEAISVSPTSINVTWKLSDIYDVDKFELCYHAVHVQEFSEPTCLTINDTKTNVNKTVNKLKPFTLYQFNVKACRRDRNQNTLHSESIQFYTNEDVPGEVKVVHSLPFNMSGNNTKVRIVWEEPIKLNGIIQNYCVLYTNDLSAESTLWNNVTVSGNKTFTTLSGLVPGTQYFVKVKAATKAGYGKLSNYINFTISNGALKVPTSSNEQKPSQNTKPDQSLGVVLGVSISVGFITICLCSIYCRRKLEVSRSLRNNTHPAKGLSRNGNGCCLEQSSTSVNQQANVSGVPNEIELAVLCPSSPIEINPHADAKGAQSNGILEICAKEPLLSPWEINGGSKDVHIMENPQYKRRGSSTSDNQQEQEQDLENTQLTMVNCTLGSSTSSLNNNSGCPDEEISLSKAVCILVPALGPND